MTDRIHIPTFVWGAALTLFGIVFTLEALDVWEFSLGDLRYAGPLVLLAIGVILVFTARRPTRIQGPPA
jgi:small neutral amino acid transporter SnatA (MarC family)